MRWSCIGQFKRERTARRSVLNGLLRGSPSGETVIAVSVFPASRSAPRATRQSFFGTA